MYTFFLTRYGKTIFATNSLLRVQCELHNRAVTCDKIAYLSRAYRILRYMDCGGYYVFADGSKGVDYAY